MSQFPLLTLIIATLRRMVGLALRLWLIARTRPGRLSMGFGAGMLLAIALSLLLSSSPSQAQGVSFPAAPDAQLEAGGDRYQAGDLETAAQLWAAAAQGYDQQGDRPAAAIAYSRLSLAQQQLGQWDEATRSLQAAAQQLTQAQAGEIGGASLTQAEAQVWNTQGRLDLALGRTAAALQAWQQATQLYQQLGDEDGSLGSQVNQALALERLGQYRRACKTLLTAIQVEGDCDLTDAQRLDQVQRAFEGHPQMTIQILGQRTLGEVLRLMGNLNASEQMLSQALAIAQANAPAEVALTALNLGMTHQAQYQRAREIYRQTGLSRNREQTDQYRDQAQALYSQALQAAGRSPQSDELVTQIQLQRLRLLLELEEWRRDQPRFAGDESYLEAVTELGEALYENIRHQGQEQEALEFNRLPSYERVNGHLALAQLLLRIHPFEPDGAWLRRAELTVQPTLRQAQMLQDGRLESLAQGTLGRVYEMAIEAKPAVWPQAQQLTEAALGQAQAKQLWDLAYQWQWQLGRLYRDQGQTERAIAHYEAAVQTLSDVRRNLLGIDTDLQFSFRDTVEPIYRQWVELLLNQSDTPSQATLQQAIQAIDALQVSELENFLRCNLAQAVELSQEKVDPTAAVLYPIILPNQLAVITRLPGTDTLSLHRVEQPAETVESTIIQLRRELEKPYPSRAGKVVAETLYNWLIRPIQPVLAQEQVKTLVFVLDGNLRNVPMAVLFDGDRYLVEQYAIALMPGLQLIEPRPLAQIRLNVLTFGLSEIRPDFPPHEGFAPLENVALELKEIESRLPSRQFVNQDFTEDTMQQFIGSVSSPVIHLATHGQFSSEPENTFILAWDRRVGVDDLSSILQLRDQDNNPIELLVLSACKTADGDNRAALGLAGIAVQSGARSTLASLWYVDDKGTAELMSRFYEELATADGGITKAEALRQAQVSLLTSQGYAAPLYWAPYVLVGNWL